jgi:hypothetical protein
MGTSPESGLILTRFSPDYPLHRVILDLHGGAHEERVFMDIIEDSPDPCGQTCAFIASG